MSKIITGKTQIIEALTRGVETVYPSAKALEKELASGRRLRIYCGFDPSAPSLHIGNAIQINKLAQFQRLGHKIIFLIGDFTGMIGDPTDKAATRKKLAREEVLANAKSYAQQASAYIKFDGDNPALVKYNSEWSDKLTFKDLIELSSNFTVQQMIQRDMFQERLKEEKPIHLHEFLYPLAQGYDSVAMDVDLEIGGNDQMFNMMCGRDLMKAVKGKEKFVMTLKLLADDTGKKMGKSEGNVVFLNESFKDMYGKIMSWPDGVIGVAFELCTGVATEEITSIYGQLKDGGVNPRDLKMKLAREITRMVHGEKNAQEAEQDFINRIQKKDLGHIANTAETVRVASKNILDVLVECGLASSKGEARRLIAEGAIKINDKAVKDINYNLSDAGSGILIQRGRKQARKVKLD
jgi:tyrosyl-tRNA synthetase